MTTGPQSSPKFPIINTGVMACGHPERQWERRGRHLETGQPQQRRGTSLGNAGLDRRRCSVLSRRAGKRPQCPGAGAVGMWHVVVSRALGQLAPPALGTFSLPPGWRESKAGDRRCGQGSGDMKALIPSHMDGDGKLSNYCGK